MLSDNKKSYLAKCPRRIILMILIITEVFFATWGSSNIANAAVVTTGAFSDKKVDGWAAGNNVTSVYNVANTYPYTSPDAILNGPGDSKPINAGMIQANVAVSGVAGNAPKTIYKSFEIAQDWTATPIVTLYINSYGGCPGASHYYAKIVAYSGTNSSDSITEIYPDGWNFISLDLTSWSYKNSVTKLEVTLYTDSSIYWNGHFQIQKVQLFDSTFLNIIGDFERSSGMDGWVAGGNTNSIARVSTTANAPGWAERGGYCLEASTASVAGNAKRTVSRSFSTNQDWTSTPIVTAYINGYGGAPGATNYYADLTIWSGTQSTTFTKKIGPDAWNLIKVNIEDLSYKNAVSQIDISYYSDGTGAWNGSFQIDDISHKADNFPTFTSSNSNYTDLLNDMLYLHWNAFAGPNPRQGNGQSDWREWDAISTAWMNTNQNLVRCYDYNQELRDNLLNTEMDSDGYVYMYYDTNDRSQMMWPFPSYIQSNGSSLGWEFDGDSGGFIGTNISNQTFINSCWDFDTTVNDPCIAQPGLTIDAYNSPYIFVRMKSNNANTSGAIYFTTSTSPNYDESKKAMFTIINDGEYHDYYIPVYKNPSWTGTVCALRLDPVETGNAGGHVSIDFINCCYDARHMTTNSGFILGSLRYFLWNPQDVAFIQAQMGRLRNAIHFMQTQLNGDMYNYVNCPWWGHDGTSGVSPTVRSGYGLGGNFWDILPSGAKDAYATIYYFAALNAMSTLESLVATNPGWGITANPYGESSSTFSSKAANVKIAFNNTFWDTTNLRYISNIDVNGVAHDYGAVYLNLEAIDSGISDDTKISDIYSWLNGTRIISSDTSTGADIYSAFTFAPRATTKRNTDWYLFLWTYSTSFPWGGQVQDGGAVLYTSYYDVMNRIKYNGVADGWARLKAILDWYNATQNEGGYRQYFANRGIVMQGGGTAGGVGVDSDFTESTMVPLAFLYGVMGINATPDSLRFEPKLPDDFTWYRVDKACYKGNIFSAYASTTVSRITAAIESGTVNIQFASLIPNQSYTVLKDGVTFVTETSDALGQLTITTSGTGTHSYEITR